MPGNETINVLNDVGMTLFVASIPLRAHAIQARGIAFALFQQENQRQVVTPEKSQAVYIEYFRAVRNADNVTTMAALCLVVGQHADETIVPNISVV